MKTAVLIGFVLVFAMAMLTTTTGEVYAYELHPVILSDSAELTPQESKPEANLPFLFAVFFIAWAAFFGYVFYMSRRQREMQREIDALTRALNDRES